MYRVSLLPKPRSLRYKFENPTFLHRWPTVKNHIITVGLTTTLILVSSCSDKGSVSGSDKLGKAKANFERACSTCHSLDVPLARSKSAEGWKQSVHNMRIKGAALSEAEGDAVAEYLHSIRPIK